MASTFIGKPISLISHSDVRYRGILAGIDPAASTIQLSNVFSMGTESRRPALQYIPPMAEPYEYIIFKASEVKDLSVDDHSLAAPRNVHDDPAVMASAPIANANFIPPGAPPQIIQQQYAPRVPQPQVLHHQQPPVPLQQRQNASTPAPQADGGTTATFTTTTATVTTSTASTVSGGAGGGSGQATTGSRSHSSQNRRPNPIHTAAASLETVERALGDLRVSGGGIPVANSSFHAGSARSGRRSRGDHHQQPPLKVPTFDFDFASSNAKFDKSAIASPGRVETPSNGDSVENDDESESESEQLKEKEKEKGPVAYNPQKSFFDTLSSNSAPEQRQGGGGNGGRGGGGRGRGGRSRRDEEREKNVATFGEPGGVGLMGPGAYVGGWGGYGRRGGRPRRGGGGGGGNGGRGGSPSNGNNNQTHVVQTRG